MTQAFSIIPTCLYWNFRSCDYSAFQQVASLTLDLLQVSLLINKQTGGKKKKRDRKMEGEWDLWTTRSENETGQDLDRRLSLTLAEEPIKLEQVNAEPRFLSA